ncbi:MAG: prephenate dehydratase domain-containing protein [Eubacteriales bacterium]
MDELQKAINQVKETDRALALAFEARMNAGRHVAACQRAEGLPPSVAVDPDETLREVSPLLGDDLTRSYYALFLQNVVGLSECLNHRVADGQRVAYAGVVGAFAHLTAKKIFPDATLVAYPGFREAYEAVEKGECDSAVLPLENSFAGDVAQVMDLAYFGHLYVNAVYDAPIHQCLVGCEGATLDTVKKVISHPQALSQCAPYLASRGYEIEEESNTAVAARRVSETGDPTLAAICSPEAAELYRLHILAANINENANNTTRFAVLTRNPHRACREDGCFILTFTVKNEAGALARAIASIGEHGFNMRSLRSRPTKKLIWSNFFFVEAEGNLNSPAGQAMLDDLGTLCSGLKVLGSYERVTELD